MEVPGSFHGISFICKHIDLLTYLCSYLVIYYWFRLDLLAVS